MNTTEKIRLSNETHMQLKALKKIEVWKNIAVALSTLGVALTYAGMAGNSRNLFLGIPGVIIILAGLISALILNLGLKNGRRNVKKMLRILEEKELIIRTLGNEDRRQMYFHLSPTGKQRVTELELDKVEIPELLKPLF